MPESTDNQVVDEPDVGLSERETETITDPESSPTEEPSKQLSDIDQIIATLPENQQQLIKDAVLRDKDYRQKTQTVAEQRKMIDRLMLENKQKIEFYDNFVNNKELRKEMALREGFVEPKGEKAINKKALELMEAMNPDERETIDYIVEQAIEKRLHPVNEFIKNQTASKQQSRQNKVKEVFTNFCSSHKDYESGNEIDIAMRAESDALGLDFNTMPPEKIKVALNTLYKSATADRQAKMGMVAATKKLVNQNTVARKNSERSNMSASPNVSKSTKTYETMDEMFGDLFG